MVLRLCIIFALLLLGCSNPYERDNPTDPIFVYTVTFNASDATSGTPPAAVSGSWGDVIPLPEQGGLAKTGYVFAGWNTGSSNTGTRYKINYAIEGNATLYAMWVSCSDTGYFCDVRDGKLYATTTIGTQVWMKENLNYNASDSKCYDNLESNCDIYGRLYNWATAMSFDASCNSSSCSSQVQSKHKGVCPSGWHIPSDANWNTLINYAGGQATAGKKLKATSGWPNSYGENGNGTDNYGFSALPSGFGGGCKSCIGHGSDGSFEIVGYRGYWWSATENNARGYEYEAVCRTIDYYGSDRVSNTNEYKVNFLSVRCVKD